MKLDVKMKLDFEGNNVTKDQFRKQVEDIVLRSSQIDFKTDLLFKTKSKLDKSNVNKKIDDLTSLLFSSNETVTINEAVSFLQDFIQTSPYEKPYDPLSNRKLAVRWIPVSKKEASNPHTSIGKCYQYSQYEVKELMLSKLNNLGEPIEILPLTLDNLALLH